MCIVGSLSNGLSENARDQRESTPPGEESIEPVEKETSAQPEAEREPQDTVSTDQDVGDRGGDGEEGEEAPETASSKQQAEESSEEVITETVTTVGQCSVL